MKDSRKIPITPVQEPPPLAVIEKQATDLASFIGINLTFKR